MELQDLGQTFDIPPAPAWHAKAACRGLGGLMYGDGRGPDRARALAVCRSCQVRRECATAGAYEEYGIWGGRVRDGTAGIETRVMRVLRDQPFQMTRSEVARRVSNQRLGRLALEHLVADGMAVSRNEQHPIRGTTSTRTVKVYGPAE